MALNTAGDLISLAFKASMILGVGQTPSAEDSNDALNVLNLLLSEWQLNRWVVYDLVETVLSSTAETSYSVGPSADFNTSSPRPDKIDAAFARLISTGEDYPLFPFMSREGYDKVANKSLAGIPYSYFYDPGLSTTGTIYFYPVPADTYELHINSKASLGQLDALTSSLTLPAPYTNALLWNLAANLRPMYGLPADQTVALRAQATLSSLINSIAQVPQAVQPLATQRAGIFSTLTGSPPQQGGQQ